MPVRPGSAAGRVPIDGTAGPSAYREFTQHFPRPGWVEHDAVEIWDAARDTLREVVDRVGAVRRGDRDHQPARDGRGVGPHDRASRTATPSSGRTAGPRRGATSWPPQGALDLVRRRTGLVLDPYFSGTKFEWLLGEGGVPVSDDLALGTVDTWLIWNLTGGEVFATDATNASRTMLFDIDRLAWDDELCDLLHVPLDRLPDVHPSSGRSASRPTGAARRPASPSAASPATSRRRCSARRASTPGMAKNTYGTGSFVLLNVGTERPPPAEGMLTTVAWTLDDGTVAYALEGAIFSTGSAIQWLRDGLAHHRRRRRGRPARGERRGHRRRVHRAGVHRSRLAVVGRLRPRHGRRHHPRDDAGAPRPGGRRVDGVPDA